MTEVSPPSLSPTESTDTVDTEPTVATEPPRTPRQTCPCAGPCGNSYVFDLPGTWCYWCLRNDPDAPLHDAPPAPAGPTQDHPRREV